MRLVLLVLILVPSIAFAATRHHSAPTPTPTAAPKSEETEPSRNDLLLTVDHIVRLSQDLQKNLDNEKAAHATTEVALQKANTENANLQKQIDKETVDFNELKDKYAAQSKKLWWYRVHFFLGWVLFITGILAAATIWILKITGKLGIMAAKI